MFGWVLKTPLTANTWNWIAIYLFLHKDLFKRHWLSTGSPINTSLSIRHRFDIEISRRTLVDISSIMKGESTWKGDIEDIDDMIGLSWLDFEIRMSYPRIFFDAFSMLNQPNLSTPFSMLHKLLLLFCVL